MGMIEFPAGTRVGLDTNVLIYTVEKFPPYYDSLRPLWDAAERGDLRLVVSALALTEVLVKSLQRRDTQLETAYRRLLLDSQALICAEITVPVLKRAALLRAYSSALKIPDAIHLATAVIQGCTHFLTNDRRLRPIPGLTVMLLDDLIQ